MAESIHFPMATPQTQAAERVVNQQAHQAANLLHAQMAEHDRQRRVQAETVVEAREAENPNVDQEGHFGAEYHARKREGDEAAPPEEAPPAPSSPGEEDFQGRFINVVV
ncbi:MAG: hypothetical protein HYZ11_15200 [Candidatus Tectomicrobia bacterium]|uniref:Uncharacterized protein n=1 Tax=Tectimicrobiota bacterium TaxID=2528274 RepID=A0A932MRD2_UNCTE|nr:hypothetical protein [Candidatus Tectomicrobia bacterium]